MIAERLIEFRRPDGTVVTVPKGSGISPAVEAMIREHAPGALPPPADPAPAAEGDPTTAPAPKRAKTQKQ